MRSTSDGPDCSDGYRSVLLGLPGAVPAEGLDEGVAAHYGAPLSEQRALTAAVAVVDLSHHGLVAVTGPERLSWLHSLLSQDLAALPPGTATEALLLDPQGHVENQLQVVDDGSTTWLETEPGCAEGLTSFLDRMRFLTRVEVTDASAAWASLVIAGPQASRVLRDCGRWEPGPASGYRLHSRRWPGHAYEVQVPAADLEAVTRELLDAGAVPAGVDAWEAVRVASLEARQGRETDGRTVPHEVGWVATAVHLDKGCYRGQETVARVHAMGRAPRRMVLLHFDGTEEPLPEPGTPVRWDGREVGFVGTAVRHHELGPVGLAVVKRAVPTQAELAVGIPGGGTAAAAIDPDSELAALPGAGAGRRAQQALRGEGAGRA